MIATANLRRVAILTTVCLSLGTIGSAAEPADETLDPLPPGTRLRLGNLRWRCPGDVKAVAFSPDGKILVVAGTDRIIRFWEPATGKEFCQLIGHEDAVTSLAFSADGKFLASGGYDSSVHLWDVSNGKALKKFNVEFGWVTALAFSPDAKALAVGGRQRALQVRDIATGQELWKMHRPMWITSLVYSKDGKTLISANKAVFNRTIDDGLRLWDAATGQEVAKLDGHKGNVHALALTPDGKILASAGSDRTIRLWDLVDKKETTKIEGHLASVYTLGFATDGQTLASGSADGTIRLWESATGKERHSVTTAQGEVLAIALAPDGKTVASAHFQNQAVQLWDTATGKNHATVSGHGAAITTLAFSPDSTTLASGAKERTIRLWDLKSGKERQVLEGHQTAPFAVAFSPDGKTLASTGQRRKARLWDTTSGKELAPFNATDNWVLGFAFAADSQPRAWTTGAVTAQGNLNFARFNAFGGIGTPQAIYLNEWNGPKELRALKTEMLAPAGQQNRWAGHAAPIAAVAAATSRRDLVASGSEDKTVGLWRMQTGKFLASLEGHGGAVRTVAFAADDRILVSSGDDRTIRLWEVATFQRLLTIAPKGAADIRAVALSPESRFVAWAGGNLSPDSRNVALAGGTDHVIHVVDLASGKERLLAGHGGSVTALAFSPNGQWLASGSADTTLLVWDLRTLDLPAKVQPLPATLAELDKSWSRLSSSDDVAKVYEAMGQLLASPGQVVPFFKSQLAEGKKTKPISQLIAELDDQLFAVRSQAAEELENLGELSRPDIVKAIESKPSLEVRQRLDDLLRSLDQRMGRPTPDELRQIRAVQVLEWLGTPESRQLLDELAKGSSAMWQTQEAKAAVERLNRKQAN
jgi:WD40 repeat protein